MCIVNPDRHSVPQSVGGHLGVLSVPVMLAGPPSGPELLQCLCLHAWIPMSRNDFGAPFEHSKCFQRLRKSQGCLTSTEGHCGSASSLSFPLCPLRRSCLGVSVTKASVVESRIDFIASTWLRRQSESRGSTSSPRHGSLPVAPPAIPFARFTSAPSLIGQSHDVRL